MSKLKQPIISLEAKGSISDALTFQRRDGLNIVRKKPTPTQPNTLPQVYQRWLYQDYITWWHTLTNAQKQTLKSAAVRYHMGGFAYWMSTHLKDLPDIAGRYHLDGSTGTRVVDSSRNLNHGTNYGATPVDALIAHGLHFDGVDDYVHIPHSSALQPAILAYDFFVKFHALGHNDYFFDKGREVYACNLASSGANFLIRCRVRTSDGVVLLDSFLVTTEQWYYIAASYDPLGGANNVKFRVDDTTYQDTLTGVLRIDANPLTLGSYYVPAGTHTHCTLDEVTVYNRIPSSGLFDDHKERRYP